MAVGAGFASIGKNLGGSLIGMNNKAIIEIEDERISSVEVQIAEMKKRAAASPFANLSGALDEAASKLTAATDLAASSGITNLLNGFANTLGCAPVTTKRQFQVKFNPHTVTFSAQGGMKVEKRNFTTGANVAVEYRELRARIQMNVDLLFEDYARTDAFMFEKLTDAKGLVETVVHSFGEPNSVKKQVEGFIAALINPRTRKVKFMWGDMCYVGILNSVSTEYTMFSIAGHPIRATVRLGILCVDDSTNPANMGQWQESFSQAFGTGSATNLESAMQNVGNLLNVNL